MSGTTPDLPASDEVAPDVSRAAEAGHPATEAAATEAAATEADLAAEPRSSAPGEDLGMFAPTWYVLLCAMPFAAAFLLPTVLIYQQQNAVPPVTAAAAAWTGVGAGWLLWALGTGFWLLGKVVLSTPRARAPHSWAWWDRMTRAWMLVVLVWGIVASLAVVAVGILIDRLAA